ncbi:hypothetical protein [Carnobacterium alterfunditum]|uniref:hypothetical protein n=1 Tax=Carnobacterium alterfunditum TaxID=28230 RepID=UPI003593DA9D
MKRYGKLSVIAVLVVLTIGIYYIQPIFAAETKPEFTISEKKGDQELIEDMTIEGYYYENNLFGIGTDVEITTEGTTYYSNQPYQNQRQGSVSANKKMAQLQKEYRSFMRGKNHFLTNFFEDESILAYAEITTNNFSSVTEESEFKIEVLNKKTEEVLSYSVDFPKTTEYVSIYVEDVQVANNKLIVVTNGYASNKDDMQDEQHLYSIDLPNEKIEKDEKIQLDLVDVTGKQIQYVELINESTDIASAKFLVYRVVLEDTQTEMEMNQGNQEIAPPVYGLIGVNVETGEQFLIDISKEVGRQGLENTLPLENTALYTYKINETSLSIYAYQLNQKELVEVESIALSKTQRKALKEGMTMQINEGLAFFVSSSNALDKDMQIMAFDSRSGELVLEGAIDEKAGKSVKRDELGLYGILFQ